MVCSACGYENQAGMRFCGMCGMPLPHRPLTTPGAQSTLNYTRVPVEADPAEHEAAANSASATHTSAQQITPGNGSGATTSTSYTSTEMSTQHTAPVVEVPPKELVPDVSLDEYVQHFRYQPPTDPSEVTMRGDAAPIVDVAAPATNPSDAPPDDAATADGIVREPVDAEEIAFRAKVEAALRSAPPAAHAPAVPTEEKKAEPRMTPLAPPADSVASRLGLEPESPVEERRPRPRFLDITEPPKENRPASSSGTSSIVGPSFLGLSDAPLIAAEGVSPEVPEDSEQQRSHWRGWVAVAILLIFGVLGFVQWRAQVSQSGTSPLQIIRAKLDSWRHGSEKPSGADQSGATTASPAVNSQPETPAAQLPAPQASTPSPTTTPATTPPATSTTTSQAGSSPSPATQSSSPPPKPTASAGTQSPPTISNSASAPAEKASATSPSASPGETAGSSSQPAPTTADNAPAKPARRTDSSPVSTAGAGAPGADEMQKAKNASDSAASAAWLWKATAKGNPDAPVQLADMYIKGNGVPRSCEQAVVLLKTAAEKENASARNRLASMYATGNCVPRNRVEAYRWLSAALAANPNSQWAQQNRDLIWNQMTPDEQQAAQKYR